MNEITLERLQRIPLTQKLTEAQVRGLLPRLRQASLKEGEVLFRQGDPATDLYFVEKGQVIEVGKDPAGREVVRRQAGAGEYLGRYALATGLPFRVTATALEDATLLAIPLRDLQPLLFLHPDWRSWFFRTDVAARLRAVPLFMAFDDWDIYRLADQVQVQDYAEGDVIFQAGAPADSFYIIDQGQVVETGNGPGYLAAGNFFGHEDLLRGDRRRATVTARKATRLFRISDRIFHELRATRAADLPQGMARVDVVGQLRGVPLFANLSDEHLQLLAGYVSLVYHPPGDIVSRQGEPAAKLLILSEGEAIVRRQVGPGRPRPVGYLMARRGATQAQPESVHFGAHALLAEEMRGATVEVTQPSVWIALERSDFQQFLADAQLTPDDLEEGQQPAAAPLPSPPPEDRLPLPFRVRRHWIVPVSYILPLALVMVVLTFLLISDVLGFLSEGTQRAVSLGGLFLLVLLALGIAWRYVDWLNDLYEVTNEVVVHTEKELLVREERYEAPLVQIQNVNIKVSVLGRLLDYGDLSIDTAAAQGQIQFTKVPQPAWVQDLIRKATDQARSGRQIQFRESIRRQLEDQLYPERLQPAAPESVLIQPQLPPPAPPRFARLRSLWGWFPRFEIRERDRITWRKNWLNLLRRTGLPLLATLAATYLLFAHILYIVTRAFGDPTPVKWPPVSWFEFQTGLFLVTALLWGLAFLWLLYQYVDWRNDVYIVTDNEVIDVEKKLAIYPFFFLSTESRKQASLGNVQNVELQIPNMRAMIFNYGDVIIQTAGIEGALDFLGVGNPRRVQAEIVRRLDAYRERQQEREFQRRWGGMAEWFETYRDLIEHTRASQP